MSDKELQCLYGHDPGQPPAGAECPVCRSRIYITEAGRTQSRQVLLRHIGNDDTLRLFSYSRALKSAMTAEDWQYVESQLPTLVWRRIVDYSLTALVGFNGRAKMRFHD